MYNVDLYPKNFSSDKAPGVAIGGDTPSEEEVQIGNVEQQTKRSIIAQTLANRALGATTIANQNRDILTYNDRLPKEWVGSRAYPQTAVRGTKGLFAGGQYIPHNAYYYNIVTKFTYSTETPSRLGINLRHPLSVQREALCSLTDGYSAGGFYRNQWWGRCFGFVDKINLASESIQYLGEMPSNSFSWYWYRHRCGVMANGNASNGYWFGGGNHLGFMFNTADRIAYDSDIRYNLGITFLKTMIFGQSCTNQSHAYILNAHSYGPGSSGNSSNWQYFRHRVANSIEDIYKFDYATELASSLGTQMANVDHGGGAVEDVDAEIAYVGFGWTPISGHIAYAVDKFDMGSETSASTGSVLSRPRHGCSAIGSSASGFFAGGIPRTSQTNMDRFIFNNESVVALGVNLNHYLSLSAAIKDFHGGIAS